VVQRKKTKRRGYIVVALLSLVGVIATIVLSYDPEADAIGFVVREYVGNLKAETFLGAATYVHPQNLVELKQSAIRKAGMNEDFRQEILGALNVASLEDLASVPKERFFDFLVKRSLSQHTKTFDMLKKATVIGVKIKRRKDMAWVRVSLSLVEDSVQKRFRMRLSLKNENGWFVLLFE
jgi:hypothetical protein